MKASKYFNKQFYRWCNRVSKRLPNIVKSFYDAKLNGVYISTEQEKRLGFVIKSINDPFYSVTDGIKKYDTMSVISLQEILRIEVEMLFCFVNTKCKENVVSIKEIAQSWQHYVEDSLKGNTRRAIKIIDDALPSYIKSFDEWYKDNYENCK